MREAQVTAKFLKKLKSLDNCAQIKLSALGAMGTSGWPDRMILLKGPLAMFVELKATGEEPTPLQHRKMNELKALGFPVAWFDDADKAFAWVLKQLRKQVVGE